MKSRATVLLLAAFLHSLPAGADDVGITEARLIQEDGTSYALEADLPPFMVDTIQRPVLPDRCRYLGPAEQVSVGPMIVLRYRFECADSPLGPADELVLPWQRSGIVLTAYWLDGSSQRTFFDRQLAGIRVPIRLLGETQATTGMLVLSGVKGAADYLMRYGWMHVLLVLACASTGRPRRLARLVLAFAGGHGLALIATDLGAPTVPEALGVLLLGLAAILIFRSCALRKARGARYWPLLVTLGIVHGLVYEGPAAGQGAALLSTDLVMTRFAFNTSVDLAHGLLVLGVWGAMAVVVRSALSGRIRATVTYLGGGLAVAAVLAAVPGAFVPVQSGSGVSSRPVSATPGAGKARAVSRPVDLEDPLMGFVTVTAFEVRCEWLVRVRDLEPETEMSEAGVLVIPVDAQADLKEQLKRRFEIETVVSVDGPTREPSAVRADFVTVGTYGVTSRSVAAPEPVDEAVVGITLAYPVADAPRDVGVRLDPYPRDVASVPVAVADPWGSVPRRLTPDAPRIQWERRMAGFRRPIIRPVEVAVPGWPWASAGLLVLAMLLAFLVVRGWSSLYVSPGTVSACCVAALVAYPFVRAPLPGILAGGVPAEEETRAALTQLLTNIYRAFDYRTEDAIYDRLEISATGDQLAAIYLEHLRAMELENRGGARASVDNVDVEAIKGVTASESGFNIDAGWTVSGSVSHFGHTHYRTNRYSAVVSILRVDDAWKISGIEVTEEERVL